MLPELLVATDVDFSLLKGTRPIASGQWEDVVRAEAQQEGFTITLRLQLKNGKTFTAHDDAPGWDDLIEHGKEQMVWALAGQPGVAGLSDPPDRVDRGARMDVMRDKEVAAQESVDLTRRGREIAVGIVHFMRADVQVPIPRLKLGLVAFFERILDGERMKREQIAQDGLHPRPRLIGQIDPQ